jgi:purine-binding chemotaxis protein CheW
MTETTLTPPEATRAAAGKYLTFLLGRESYGIQVLKVREIIRLTDITAVPRMPNYVKGVINLRGKIIPVLDLRQKFGLPVAEATERTCVVVVQVRLASGTTTQLGVIVDAVEEVLQINASDIEETPDFGGNFDTDCILGMAKIRGAVKTLLDIDWVVGGETLASLTPS